MAYNIEVSQDEATGMFVVLATVGVHKAVITGSTEEEARLNLANYIRAMVYKISGVTIAMTSAPETGQWTASGTSITTGTEFSATAADPLNAAASLLDQFLIAFPEADDAVVVVE